MYKCTECNTEYEVCPEFCDCGNDTFEEINEEDVYYNGDDYEEIPVKKTPAKRKMSAEEKAELAKEKQERKKSLIAAGIIFVLCIIVFIIPPHKKPKMEKVKEKVAKENVKIPSVDSYWDNSVPSAFKKKDPLANLPLLNTKFRSISPVLREYLVNIGGQFNKKWDTSMVSGVGECKVEFTINKEGILNSKRIVVSSDNESLDNSVLLVLSNINGFDVPPDDYKGERVYITFKVEDKGSHVVYPMQ